MKKVFRFFAMAAFVFGMTAMVACGDKEEGDNDGNGGNGGNEPVENPDNLPTSLMETFDNGILFAVGKSTLTPAAQASLRKFATNVLNVYTDCDVSICGFASSDGSDQTNLTLSQSRAASVQNFLTGNCGVSSRQIKGTTGYGEDPNYLIYDANGKEDRNASRRVEVYLYASDAMIKAAEAGTLQ